MADILEGRANSLPYDVQAEQSALQRKRQMIRLMMQQMSQGHTGGSTAPGGIYVPDTAGSLAKVLTSVMGAYGDSQLGDQEKAISADQMKQQSQDVAGFNDRMMGAQPQGPMPDGSAMPETKADTAKAMAYALGTRSSITQDVGKEWAKKQAQGVITPDDQLKAVQTGNVNPETVGADPTKIKLTPKITVSDGVQVQTPAIGGEPTLTPVNRYKPPTPGTSTMPPLQEQEGTGAVKALSGGNTTPAIPGKQFNQALSVEEVKLLAEGRQKAMDAAASIRNIATAQAELAGLPANNLGPMTDVRLAFNQFLEQMGAKPIAEGTSVQRINAALGERVLERLRMFAPVSDTDVTHMRQIAGSTKNSKAALEKILEQAVIVANRSIQTHNKFADELGAKEGYGDLSHFKVADTGLTGGTPSNPGKVVPWDQLQ